MLLGLGIMYKTVLVWTSQRTSKRMVVEQRSSDNLFLCREPCCITHQNQSRMLPETKILTGEVQLSREEDVVALQALIKAP